MKRFPILLSFLVVLSMQSWAQVLFSEDFEDGMPANFKLINVDGLTPASGVSYVTDAWVTREGFDDPTDTVAASTSWYDPAGTSNDWMITPKITLDSFCILTWNAKAQDADFPDGYQVRISTGGDSIPDFNANFALFNINGEQSTWTSRAASLYLAGYANQDVYIAFRNISNDQFVLLIDDIQVKNLLKTDGAAVDVEGPGAGCFLSTNETISITVNNAGRDPMYGFDITYIIDDGDTIIAVTESLPDTLMAGAQMTYAFSQTADFSVPGIYDVYGVVGLSGDGDVTNDTVQGLSVINVETAIIANGPYTSSFETVPEILGWNTEDINNDGFGWALVSGAANTGDLSFLYQYNTDATTPADDWLYSTCVDLVANQGYKLSFYATVGNSQGTVFPEKLEVFLGASPDTTNMTMLLEDLGELTNDTYELSEMSFTAPSTGTFYVGFHCYSDADKFFLGIDDIELKELVAPTAGFNSSATDLTADFVNISTDADSSHWDFGDGTTSSDANPMHTYSSSGTYSVCLMVFNAAGMDSVCQSVTVTLSAPTAGFGETVSGLAVDFGSTSTGTVDSLAWDFGDGQTGSGTFISHTYDSAGTYYVCVTAFNDAGSDTFCDSVTVGTVGIALIDGLETFKMYPNPVNAILNVELMFSSETNVEIFIHDIAGRNIIGEVKSTSGDIYSIDVSALGQGIYNLVIEANGESMLRKFVVTH